MCGIVFDPTGKYKVLFFVIGKITIKVDLCTGAPALDDQILFELW